VVYDTKDLIGLINKKSGDPVIVFKEVKEGQHDYSSWSKAFPEFLLWAVGKH
jgi:hypothetical protein